MEAAIASMIPVAIKVGILFLVLMAPFKWEKELGVLLEKGQAMGRQAIGTAAGMAFGALPYVMKKKMDSGSAKMAGEDLTKMRSVHGTAQDDGKYSSAMAAMKKKRAEDFIDNHTMNSMGLDEDAFKKFKDADPTAYETEKAKQMEIFAAQTGQMPEVEEYLEGEIRKDAEKSAQKIPEESREKYIASQIEKINHSDLQKNFADSYNKTYIPLFGKGFNAFGKNFFADLKPSNTGDADKDEKSRQRVTAWAANLGNTLNFVQTYNPMGLASAWKEKTELNAKNIEKAHYRSSKLTEWTLGPEAALKHQMAIQKEDMAHIYTSEGMRGSAYWKSYQKAVKKLAADMGVSMREAGDHFRTELRRMQEEQAPKTEYNQYLGGLVSPGEAAAIIEGHDRASTIVAQEARSHKPRSLIQMEADEAMSNFHNAQTGAPEPRSELDLGVDSAAGPAATNPDMAAPSINTTSTYNFSNMTTDEFAGLVNKREEALGEIRRNMTQGGVSASGQSVIIQALRDANGGALSPDVVRRIKDNSGLDKLVGRFQAMRKTEIDALTTTTGGSDLLYRTMADSIAKGIVNSGSIRDAISKARSGTPDEINAAHQTIAKAIKQNTQTVAVDPVHTISLVEKGLQIIETQ